VNRTPASDIVTDALERETGFAWGWFVVLGVALLALGAAAFLSLPAAATPSLHVVGTLMLFGAMAQLAPRLLVPEWKGAGLLTFSAILFGVAGVLLIVNPLLASNALTLTLALALILCGVMRIRLSAVMPVVSGCGWVTATGLVSVAAGIAFIHLLLVHPIWILGVVLAIDLTFQGAMAFAFGLALRAMTRR
jgi:uncharacterized membrane protein HdeD (DUF308 family)